MEKEIKIGDLLRAFHPKPKRGVPFKFPLPWSDSREVVGNHGVVLTVCDPNSPKMWTVPYREGEDYPSTWEAGA